MTQKLSSTSVPVPRVREYRLACAPDQAVRLIEQGAIGQWGFEARDHRFVLSWQIRADRWGEALVGSVQADEAGSCVVVRTQAAYPTWRQARSLLLGPAAFLAVYYAIGLFTGSSITPMMGVFYAMMVGGGGLSWSRAKRRRRLVALLQSLERSVEHLRRLPESTPFRQIPGGAGASSSHGNFVRESDH